MRFLRRSRREQFSYKPDQSLILSPRAILYQMNRLLPILFAVYVPTLLILCLVLVIALITNTPISDFTRDPSAIMEAPPYTGLLSNIGVLIWSASAAICLFAYVVLRRNSYQKVTARFFLFAGLFTTLLVIDDFFLVHEKLGIYLPEIVIMAVYAVLAIIFLFRYRNSIMQSDFILFAMALVFFAVSMSTDLGLINVQGQFLYVLEDSFKLLGIVSWTTYFTRTSMKSMMSVLSSLDADSDEAL